MIKCTFCEREFKNFQGRVSHEFRAHTEKGNKHNPNQYIKTHTSWNRGLTKETDDRVKRNSIVSGNAKKGKPGHSITQETRNKLSLFMKDRHEKGLAHNIGQSRWNNKPSYPEQFFMKVIENEFQDKNYVREMSLGKFSLDFAWPKKKLCIEIDGEQHDRFEEQKRRDKEKEKLLIENDWKLLRIKWKDMFHNTKLWINKSKEFIDYS